MTSHASRASRNVLLHDAAVTFMSRANIGGAPKRRSGESAWFCQAGASGKTLASNIHA